MAQYSRGVELVRYWHGIDMVFAWRLYGIGMVVV